MARTSVWGVEKWRVRHYPTSEAIETCPRREDQQILDTMLVRWFPQRAAVGKLLFQDLNRSSWRSKPMTTLATHNPQHTTTEGTLFVAFELSEKTWKLGFTTGHGQKPRERTVTARQQE